MLQPKVSPVTNNEARPSPAIGPRNDRALANNPTHAVSLANEPRAEPSQPKVDVNTRPGGATTISPTPDIRTVDIDLRAHEAYKAMKGGVTGLGTEQYRLFRALEGLSKENIQKVQESYKTHYGRDLNRDITAELRDEPRYQERMRGILQGDKVRSIADGIAMEFKLPVSEKGEIVRLLRAANPEELTRVKEILTKEFGKPVDELLAQKLSGHELKEAQALLRNDRVQANAERLIQILEGSAKLPPVDILDRIREIGPRDQLISIGNILHGSPDFKNVLDKLPVEVRTIVEASLRGEPGKPEIIILDKVLKDPIRLEETLVRTLEERTSFERKAILEGFKEIRGEPLGTAVEKILGPGKQELIRSITESGVVPAVHVIHSSLQKPVPDMGRILSSLETRTPDEVKAVTASFEKQFGQGIEALAATKLDATQKFDLKLALQGAPSDISDDMIIARARHEYERKGVSVVSAKAMDLCSTQGKVLDSTLVKLETIHEELSKYGKKIEDEEEIRFGRLIGFLEDEIATYREAKRSLARFIGNLGSLFFFAISTTISHASGIPLWLAVVIGMIVGFFSQEFIKAYVKGNTVSGDEIVDRVRKYRKGRRVTRIYPGARRRKAERELKRRLQKKRRRRS